MGQRKREWSAWSSQPQRELAKSLAFQFLIVLVQAVWDLVDDVFHPQHRSLAVLPEMETQRVHWMMVVLFASVACVEIFEAEVLRELNTMEACEELASI